MEYIGTIFVAIIAFVLGYVVGNIRGRKVMRRIAEDVMDNLFSIGEEQKDE